MPLKSANRAFGRLSAAIAASDISISLRPTDPLASFPTLLPGDWTYGTIFAADGNPGDPEDVRIDAINGNVLSVTRGIGRSVAQAWQAGDRIELRVLAEVFDDVRSPPPPVFLTAAEYAALDPVDPEVLYGVQEEEDRPIPPDTLLTGPRLLEAYRSLPAGQRLTPADLDGFNAAVDARVVAETITTMGPLIARCAVPMAADYTDGNDVAAARWTVAAGLTDAWSASTTNGDMAWNLFDAAGAPQHRPPDSDDGWWVRLLVAGVEMDRQHLPAGRYGPLASRADLMLTAGPAAQALRLWVWKVAPTTGQNALPRRVLVSVRGAGQAVQDGTTIELRSYRVAAVAGA